MNRDDAKVFLRAGLIALFVLLSAVAMAADMPCPPKRYLCIEVQTAVSIFGEPAVREKAKKCGWPDRKIEEARKCLRN